MAHLLGVRTAELHEALSSRPEVQDVLARAVYRFLPPWSLSRDAGADGTLAGRAALAVEYASRRGAAGGRRTARQARPTIRGGVFPLRDQRISGARIRIHGDYQLSNLLFTGNDVIIRNFDGPAGRPLSERRIKRSALRDVASMIRSLHYAAHAVSFGYVPGVVKGREQETRLDRWAEHWHEWVSAMFLQGYLESIAGHGFSAANATPRGKSCCGHT